MKRALVLLQLVLLLGAGATLRAQNQFFDYTPREIDFGLVTVGQSDSATVFVAQFLEDDLDVTAASDNPAFTVSPSSLILPVESSDMFTVRFIPPAGGPHTGMITFTSMIDGVTEILGQVSVQGTGLASLSVNPTSLEFDPVLVGSSATQTLRVLPNPQAGLTSVVIQSSNPSVFSVTPTEVTASIIEDPIDVTVTFTPNAGGLIRGAILVSGAGTTLSVPVQGEGVAFLLSDNPLDLGGALVGCSTAQDLTVITGGEFDFEFVPTTGGLPFSFDPSAFTTSEPSVVTGMYAPTGPGQAQGIYRVFARSDGRIVQQEDLTVTGIGGQPVAGPASIDFGNIPTGTTSSPRSSIVALNPPAQFQGVFAATSDNPAFEVVSTNTSGRVEVVFAPTTEGPASGMITVEVADQSDRECSVPVAIPVMGVGTEALLTVSPTSIDFGATPVGQPSETRQIQVTNDSSISFSGTTSNDNPQFTIIPTGSGSIPGTFTVAPGGSVQIPVAFSPTEVGGASGTITIEVQGTPVGSSDPINLVRQVAVSGVATAAEFTYRVTQNDTPADISPGGNVTFGPTSVGSTATVNFEVRNGGASPAPVDVITVSGAPFTASGLPALPATIEPGSAISFALSFAPNQLGALNGTLLVGAAEFSIAGRGTLTGLEITGIEGSIPGNTQPRLQVVLAEPAQQDLNGTLTMTYSPSGARPDPTVMFLTGAMTVPFMIAQGTAMAVFPNGEDAIGFQSGTVAADFAFTASLASGETDVTPVPVPARSGSVAAGAPTISSVSVESVTGTGFTVVIEGFSPTLEVSSATFNFTGRSGIELQPSSVTPSGIGEAFQAWYESEDSEAYGSMFTLTVPFTIGGETNAIASVSVTVSNTQGASDAMSANLP